MHLINRVTNYLLFLIFALDIFSGATTANVFYGCRDNPIKLIPSKFTFSCSNPTEVIYVESAIIGFTPLYKADNNIFQCPVTSDTCTKTIPEPSTTCNGYNVCTLTQRILLSKQSGLLCNISGLSANLVGNFINVNYSCISRDLCSQVAGLNGRYVCPTSTISTTSSSTLLPATTASLSFSTARNITTSTSPQIPTVVSESTKPLPSVSSKKSQLIAGVIAGIVVAVVVSVAAIIGFTVYALRRISKRKREDNNPLPRPEDLTDTPQGDGFSQQLHASSSASSAVGSISEVPRDNATYEKLNRSNELSPVYDNLASIDHDYQRLQITN